MKNENPGLDIISIHAPTRGATRATYTHSRVVVDFNPRSHKGSDLNQFPGLYPDEISIHAPTRGATETEIPGKPPGVDFNPRSHKGSDTLKPVPWPVSRHFNPRSHKGSDSGAASNSGGHGLFQSTLPQGERQRLLRELHLLLDFNPRSHKGSDWIATQNYPGAEFQSTLPQGERRIVDGSDNVTGKISIHAPTRGATRRI